MQICFKSYDIFAQVMDACTENYECCDYTQQC